MRQYKIAALCKDTHSYLMCCSSTFGYGRVWGFLGGECNNIWYESMEEMEYEFIEKISENMNISFNNFHHLGILNEVYYAIIIVNSFSSFSNENFSAVCKWDIEDCKRLNIDKPTRDFLGIKLIIPNVLIKTEIGEIHEIQG